MFRKGIIILLAVSWLIFGSWGGTGHWNISNRSSNFMPADLLAMLKWADSLSSHASDADYRKDADPGESPRHYIDLENFPDFLSTGKIIHSVDSAYLSYGSTFLHNNGSLPYATLIAYDSLVNAFIKNDIHKIVYFASDIGHYVADGHMPLHLTRNYDGQYTGQDGVHYRIETKLINTYISQIQYSGENISALNDVDSFVFQYIYDNYIYVDSLLYADSMAYAQTGTHSGSAFYSILWTNCNSKMIRLFRKASMSIARMIYSAALAAHAIGRNQYVSSVENVLIIPNPSDGHIRICFPHIASDCLDISIYDMHGNLLSESANNLPSEEMSIDVSCLPQGSYIVRCNDQYSSYMNRFVIIK